MRQAASAVHPCDTSPDSDIGILLLASFTNSRKKGARNPVLSSGFGFGVRFEDLWQICSECRVRHTSLAATCQFGQADGFTLRQKSHNQTTAAPGKGFCAGIVADFPHNGLH